MDSVILKPRTAAINSSRDMIVVANGATFVFGATNFLETAPPLYIALEYTSAP